MFDQFHEATYLPILKWKLGESLALESARGKTKDRLLPLLVIPPSGEFDHETGRILGPIEHIRSFGSRLFDHWGKRLAFVDGRYLDNERHKVGLKTHPLTELLERARLAGAIACPVTGIDRSEEYQSAVERFIKNHSPLPICIRVNPIQLDSTTLKDDLKTLLSRISCGASRAVLVLDLGALDLREFKPFADLLLERINDFPFLHEWLTFAITLTSFPEKIVLNPGEWHAFQRTDWLVHEHLMSKRDHLLRVPLFGDYAVEYPAYKATKRATPSAHFRYSTDKAYHIEKGKSTRKPNGYAAIFPVAKALVARPEFKGSGFSEGDAFIERLTRGSPPPGSASTWRWATTDHHLTLVSKSLGALFGVAEEKVVEPSEPQPQLF